MRLIAKSIRISHMLNFIAIDLQQYKIFKILKYYSTAQQD